MKPEKFNIFGKFQETDQNVFKQGNEKEGKKTHTFTTSVSLHKTEMENLEFLKANAYNGILFLAVTFCFILI